MKFFCRKIITWSIILLAGISIGAIITFYLTQIISRKFAEVENRNSIKHEIISPYVILTYLRKNDTQNAIEHLESRLDGGLIAMAYSKNLDEEDYLVLEKVRKYRKKYPRTDKNPKVNQIVNGLLFPEPVKEK